MPHLPGQEELGREPGWWLGGEEGGGNHSHLGGTALQGKSFEQAIEYSSPHQKLILNIFPRGIFFLHEFVSLKPNLLNWLIIYFSFLHIHLIR